MNFIDTRSQARRESNLVQSMTDEQVQLQRNRHLTQSMTDEQVQRHRFSNTVVGMSEERHNYQLARDRVPLVSPTRQHTRQFRSVAQFWDFDNPCPHCSAYHLTSATAHQRSICCRNGDFKTNPKYPTLYPLPEFLKTLMVERTEHFSSRSAYYNNVFSIACTGYESSHTREVPSGPSAVAMNGRSYHFIPSPTNGQFGGVSNFLYDASYQLAKHAGEINRERSIVYEPFLRGLYDEFVENNDFCKELQKVGTVIRQVGTNLPEPRQVQAQVSTETNRFEVGVLISHDKPGELVYTYRLGTENLSAPMHCSQLEPLVYPVLFPHGVRNQRLTPTTK